jgi:predicted Zn-dependent protease
MAVIARQNFVQVSKVEVSGFVSYEEDADEVVVAQWVNLSAPAALAYWEKLGNAVQGWTAFLPKELAQVAIEKIAIEVNWNGNDRAT